MPKETVIIELVTSDRLKLNNQIYARMEELGYTPYDYDALELGFHLPISWPADKDSEITLSQLTVIAYKLKMVIVINDLNLIPHKEDVG